MNSLNSKTPTKNVWDKFRKVNGNYKPRTIPLERAGNIITLLQEIAETFYDHYANISRDPHKKSKPGKNRKRKKEEELPFNKLFTDRELKTTIKQQSNTTPEEDTIHPHMMKRLPPETLKYLKDMYNKIREQGKIPSTWKHATIRPKRC